VELYALNNSVRDTFEAGLEKIVRHTAEAASAGYRFLFERGYPVLHNSEEQTLFAADVAREIVGSEHVDARMQPVMGAEDFAFMLRKSMAAMCFLDWVGKTKPDRVSFIISTMISMTMSCRTACATGLPWQNAICSSILQKRRAL
jgi:metal-dependent amidase/aminoacylase/carboxypeptidase family protein